MFIYCAYSNTSSSQVNCYKKKTVFWCTLMSAHVFCSGYRLSANTSPLGWPRFQLLLKVNGIRANMGLWSVARPMVPFFSELACSKPCTLAPVLKFLWGQKIKFLIPFHFVVRKITLMRGFQIWSQNSNRITFDPLLKKTVENWPNIRFFQFRKKWSKTDEISDFASFDSFFLPKRRLNVIRFQFWDRIWNPLIRANILDHKMKGDWKLYYSGKNSGLLSTSTQDWRRVFFILGQYLTQLWEVKGKIFAKSTLFELYISISQKL